MNAYETTHTVTEAQLLEVFDSGMATGICNFLVLSAGIPPSVAAGMATNFAQHIKAIQMRDPAVREETLRALRDLLAGTGDPVRFLRLGGDGHD
ncbi:hypothetical protein G9U51_08425 [Calidifontibacter sp. DB0510]|uniref:Uncharacterized protein n=1 Tax=Metallococcus carri TaxID=1656884 RepID=A0A967EEM0_9MICO|nr:hypothetical protein [Metallococcus carri]NHN55801.1 hypothetical protein [Metallococcus carri]NOP38511.1 hypothetical protein [Calidifontibacter sp. DB2511S]